MNIVLIQPPQIFSNSQVAAVVVPSLGLLYLAAYLRERGHQVSFIDTIAEAGDQVTLFNPSTSIRGLTPAGILARIDPATHVVGISNLFSMAFPVVAAIAGLIKDAFPKMHIVLGGAHPSALPELSLQESRADFVVIGEGEVSFANLVQALEGKQSFNTLDGLAYRTPAGIKTIPKTSYIENLDQLPFPARDLVSWSKYYATHEAHGPSQEKWTPILSTRGCPFECTFCTSRLWDRRYRARSPENVVSEIEHCMSAYGMTEFHFEDENMTMQKTHIHGICRLIIDRKLNIKWQTSNGIRASVTDSETLDLMKQSGCYHIVVAPESGSERVLNDIIKKKQDLPKVTRLVRHASLIKLKSAAYFVIGLPGETIQDVNQTIRYAGKLARVGLDEVVFSNFTPLPGSDLFNDLQRKGQVTYDWLAYTASGYFSKSVSWAPDITAAKLLQLRRKAYLTFALNKLCFHPFKTLHSIINILIRREELKSERTLITFIKRFQKKVFHRDCI